MILKLSVSMISVRSLSNERVTPYRAVYNGSADSVHRSNVLTSLLLPVEGGGGGGRGKRWGLELNKNEGSCQPVHKKSYFFRQPLSALAGAQKILFLPSTARALLAEAPPARSYGPSDPSSFSPVTSGGGGQGLSRPPTEPESGVHQACVYE